MKDEIIANNFVKEGIRKVGHQLFPGEEDGHQVLKIDEFSSCYSMNTHTQ